jgi:hypothetical protein
MVAVVVVVAISRAEHLALAVLAVVARDHQMQPMAQERLRILAAVAAAQEIT